jgi:uncharacterized protein (DUF305 family)
MRRTTRRALLSAAGVAAIALGTACGGLRPGGAAPSAPFDQQFIDMMVPHHEGAVEMARVAQGRAQRPEIKAMAADIVKSQDAEIKQMKDWRKARFGSDQTPPMSKMPMVEGMAMSSSGGHGAGHGGGAAMAGQTMDMAADVEALRKAGEPFDRAFIDAMIPHHESAIDASKAAESRAQKPELKQLAREIIAAQEREIKQMQDWRKAWYPA